MSNTESLLASQNSHLVIETERLFMRPMAISDVDDPLEYQSNPEIFR